VEEEELTSLLVEALESYQDHESRFRVFGDTRLTRLLSLLVALRAEVQRLLDQPPSL
jgi:hypothetical protein